MSVSVEQTPLPGVVVITPVRFGDHRGFFSESYSAEALAEHGITTGFVQDNHSLSMTQGTIRGLHFQARQTIAGTGGLRAWVCYARARD